MRSNGLPALLTWRLLIGLGGGMVAWAASLIVVNGLANHACLQGTGRVTAWPVLTLLYLAALAASILCAWISYDLRQKLCVEGDVAATAARRARFLATWAVAFNCVFALAILFNAAITAGGRCLGP